MENLPLLRDKDNKQAYAALLALEAYSEQQSGLYPCFNDFLAMARDLHYAIRVRGFRLLCKQARWDSDGKLDRALPEILALLDDDKPTAVRQKLQALEEIVRYKPALRGSIEARLSQIDYSRFNDNMRPLILKEVAHLLNISHRSAKELSL